ncbi:hypothetical protein W02_02270 [Nitrospira sp. KM1]|uniref:hypothetical protein n=1 Tax=Nitrospira sp. KM1 TaxID=1936990 RepID=UPI0013A7A56B|nr:hypothetical protein [Nitrospira sp. KM1]BCA53087.1 hypothetical protein W02_02270 [Nitrospira sp. KM1]
MWSIETTWSEARAVGARLKTVSAHVVLVVSVLFQGCATLKVVSPDQLNGQQFSDAGVPVAHLYVDNWGIYLFKYIPLVTGNVDDLEGAQIPRLFTHNVRVDLLVDKVTQESKKRGGTIVTDLRTRDRSYWMPLTFIFWLNEFEVSANASKQVPPLESQGSR